MDNSATVMVVITVTDVNEPPADNLEWTAVTFEAEAVDNYDV